MQDKKRKKETQTEGRKGGKKWMKRMGKQKTNRLGKDKKEIRRRVVK